MAAEPESGEANAATGGLLDEVIVTAERRSSSAQDVPITMNAFSEDMLQRAGIENSNDLQRLTPGLVVSSIQMQFQPYLRGIGSENISVASDSTVAVNIDDVYIARPAAAAQEFYDIERIEVLKGPQGTLYGRNATGGAINIFTNEPTRDFDAKADIELGNEAHSRIRGTLNGPLTDKLSARLSVLRIDGDGFYKDHVSGRDDIAGEDVWGARAKLLYELSDRTNVSVGFDYLSDESAKTAILTPELRDGDPIAVQAGGTVDRDNPFNVWLNIKPIEENESYGGSLKVTHDLDTATFKSITGLRRSETYFEQDIDNTDNDFLQQFVSADSKSFSQEFQLGGETDGGINWVVGLFYFEEDADSDLDIRIAGGAVTVEPIADLESTAYAAYGQVTWPIGDRLELIGGLRYSYDEKEQDLVFLTNGSPEYLHSKKDWSAWTPRAGFRYQLTDEVNVYFTASRGFRSGGFNSFAYQPEPYDPEFIWSYEAGIKSDLAGGRARLNAAVFYYDYTDLQVTQYAGAAALGTIVNAADAEIKGAELDLILAPVAGLELNLGVSYLDASFEKFITVDPDNPEVGDQDLSGNSLPRAPEWTGNLGGQYTVQAGDYGTVVVRADYTYKDGFWFDAFNREHVSQESYGLVDARISFDHSSGKWGLGLYGRNLGDETYAVNAIRNAGLFGTVKVLGTPRTHGLTAYWKY